MGEQRGFAPLLTVDLASVTVELNLCESGARFPCKWSSVLEIYTKGDVENIPFILPNDDLIFHQINKLIEKIELCERENEELTKLRDWLLPMLMNGQARVE